MVPFAFQATMGTFPRYYPLVEPRGSDPRSPGFQSGAITIPAQVPKYDL